MSVNPFEEMSRRFAELNGKFDALLDFIQTLKPESQPPRLADIACYCRRMNISRQTAYRHIKSGKIKYVRVGGTIRIDLNSVDKLLNKTKTP